MPSFSASLPDAAPTRAPFPVLLSPNADRRIAPSRAAAPNGGRPIGGISRPGSTCRQRTVRPCQFTPKVSHSTAIVERADREHSSADQSASCPHPERRSCESASDTRLLRTQNARSVERGALTPNASRSSGKAAHPTRSAHQQIDSFRQRTPTAGRRTALTVRGTPNSRPFIRRSRRSNSERRTRDPPGQSPRSPPASRHPERSSPHSALRSLHSVSLQPPTSTGL